MLYVDIIHLRRRIVNLFILLWFTETDIILLYPQTDREPLKGLVLLP